MLVTTPQSARPTARTWRFELPDAGRFARVWVDLAPRAGLFELRCFRRIKDRIVLATSAVNRYRLRDLEAVLVELGLRLPRPLFDFFLAFFDADTSAFRSLVPSVRPYLQAAQRPFSLPSPSRQRAALRHDGATSQVA